MKVLGIDPGTLNLGWGFIEVGPDGKWRQIDHNCINVKPKTPFFERLHLLQEQLDLLLAQYQPQYAVIEKIFLGKSVDSAFKLGHIRGVCATRCVAQGAQIVEYTPRTVKKQITGSGSAEKLVVQNFLYQHLKLRPSGKSLDASDALALAFCHIMLDSGRLKSTGARI